MAMTTLTIEIDEDELRRLNEVCAARGMTVQEMFYNLVGRIHKPTLIDSIQDRYITWRGRRAFNRLRKQALASPFADMPMEEIDAEIALYRAGK